MLTSSCPLFFFMVNRLTKAMFYVEANICKAQDEASTKLLGPVMLNGLPLAIAQAAVYIKQTGIRISEYIRRYEDAQVWPQVVGADGFIHPLQWHEKTIGITWALCLQRVRELGPVGPIAVHLVHVWAFLDSTDLYYGLFKHVLNFPSVWGLVSPDEEDLAVVGLESWQSRWNFPLLPEWLLTLRSSEAVFNEAVQMLMAYHLIEPQTSKLKGRATDFEDIGYSMHPVVHLWARHSQSLSQKSQSSTTAIDLFFTLEIKKWTARYRMSPHACRATTYYLALHATSREVGDGPVDS